MNMQRQRYFGPPPTDSARRQWADPTNINNPLSKFVGNETAVRRLCRTAYIAFGKENRACPYNYAVFGPASSGKTTLCKLFADLIEIPFVEIDPRTITDPNDILVQIGKVLVKWKNSEGETLAIAPDEDEIWLPPVIVFIDEADLLPKHVQQGLLKATEPKDRMLQTGKWNVHCDNVGWFIATTERGALFDAFDTRFEKINLRLYSIEEIAKIVKLNYPEFSNDVCLMIAKFGGRIPREVLSFAKNVKDEHSMNCGDWTAACITIAEEWGIDKYGMTNQRVAILTALGKGPVSRSRMAGIAGCKEEELIKFIMPSLLAATPDQAPLVSIVSKGYIITDAGLLELDKRGIAHQTKAA